MLQVSCKDAQLPPDLRLGFVKKVYGILGSMLLITFGLTTPFIFATEATMSFFKQNAPGQRVLLEYPYIKTQCVVYIYPDLPKT